MIKTFFLILLLTNILFSQELTQTDLNIASKQHLDSADFMLNRAYKQLLNTLSKDRQQKLIKAQRAWIKFRDLNSAVISSVYEGGSIQPLIHAQAQIELTNNRTAELTKMYLEETTP